MAKTPCCERMGLKKGPWTAEEDQILTSFIHRYGHGNWRALPKQAGLLRCGKSCRLRWINYLRPDIKRGKFSKEEEEAILKLHAVLGNRWSAIAARLPGRTDNEIKNFWHTHLKKRIEKSEVHNNGINSSKYSSCSSQIITMPRVVAAIAPSSGSGSAASSFNDGLSSTSRNRSSSSPNIIAGPGFCSATTSSSDDTSGETMGNHNDGSIQLSEEMEFCQSYSDHDASSFRLLANSIQKFGEIYEKIENSRRQQTVELEKMRMEFHKDIETQEADLRESSE